MSRTSANKDNYTGLKHQVTFTPSYPMLTYLKWETISSLCSVCTVFFPLSRMLPKARVVYCSATGVTDVKNMVGLFVLSQM